MRVEKIRLRNLASLEGEWEIDLTDPAFERNGIFAITGATGAGKTTIFDAIRLALYRQTSRLGSTSKNENEIMTRGTGNCFAQLQFSVSGRRYVARWSQKRARNKSDGNLQELHHTLEEMLPDGSLKMISSQLSQTSKVIASILKMDFKHFSRAILLPQGEFAIFLNTSPAERSEILEQITGSTIYKQISMAAFEKFRDLQAGFALESAGIDKIELIPDEELAELENQRIQKSAEASRCTAHAAALDRINDLTTRRANLLDELKQLAAEEEAAAPQLEVARAELAAAKAQTVETQQKREDARPAVTAARTLDGTIRLQENELAANAGQLEKEQKATRNAERKLSETDAAIAKAKTMEQAARKELDAHPEDALLPEHFAEWSVKLGNFALLRKEIDAEIASGETLQNTLSVQLQEKEKPVERLQYLENEQKKLIQKKEELGRRHAVPGDSDADGGTYHHHRLTAALRVQQIRTFLETAERLESGRLHLEQLAKKAGQLRKKETGISDELKQLETEWRELEPRFGIPDLVAERANLRDGRPCPLCGALHHPYATGETAEETEQKSRRYRALGEMIQTLRLEQASLQSSLRLLEEQCDADRKTDAHDSAELDAELPQEWNLSAAMPDLAESLRNHLQEWEKRLEAIEKVEEESLRLQAELQTHEEEIRSLRETRKEAEHRAELTAQSLNESRNRLNNLNMRLQSTREELIGLLAPFGCPPEEAISLLRKRLKLFQERSARVEEAIRTGERLTAERTLQNDFLTHQRERLRELDTFRQTRTGQLEETRKQRAVLLNGRPADEVEKLLESAIENAAGREQKCAAQLRKLEEDAAVRTARKESAEKRLAELETELKPCGGGDSRSCEERAAEAEKQREQARLLNEAAGAIAQKLQHDAAERERRKTAEEKLGQLRRELERWKLLSDLIGKQDGKKFQEFAQSLIFEQLISEANKVLCKFSDRYELVSIEDSPLDFNVIDHYQCDDVRTVKNLSGGESFLVSMSLALALPRMTGENLQIDTLFLDEGFGTLDEDTLAHVLPQIQSLQSGGKLVGIITHVPNIEVFVPLQIRLLPAEKSGRSRIVGPGVTDCTPKR